MDDNPLPEQTTESEVREAVLRIPICTEAVREELSFYRSLRQVFRQYGKSTEDLDFLLKNLEERIRVSDPADAVLPDAEQLEKAILQHPYFKNPCDYPIRLLTILKYLKRKGFDMNYSDIDLYIDRLLQKMEAVRKVGRGLYMHK